MSVELDGNVRMRGDAGPGVAVKVVVESDRMRIASGNELVGDWPLSSIGITALHEGFVIKAEGEEFVLRTSDDVALAEEFGLAAASPRLARRLAARHNPPEPPPLEEKAPARSDLPAIGFAVAGALVVLGGTFLNIEPGPSGQVSSDGFAFWLAFVVAGVLMIAVAYIMSIGARPIRWVAVALVATLVVVFGLAIQGGDAGATEVTAYGFIAGGTVVAVAVLSSGSLSRLD